ncbi:MAG: 3-hydroxyacyl-CoA dehydrogenase family protein [Actinomycetota bacterium]|jgi:3-hydroxybutyryl-CoA dehydrogenase|nr:3-hydroxyacyl-CoA dehydrogenase family protein [Actinomycetota bacterium]
MSSGVVGVVGVVGGGRMGAGIAHVFALAGYEVVVTEQSEQAAEAAAERVVANLARALERSVGIDAGAVGSRVRFATGVGSLPADTLLVVEAVPEVASLKHEVLAAAEAVVGSDCVIASNTSSLSVSGLAEALTRPERFLGMHFFNPVPISALVEVVRGQRSAPATVERAVGWVHELGKAEIVVADSPGFATSRLGVLLGLEAIRMLEEGVASAQDIDRAMELGYRHPMGPLRSSDLVGLDVRLAIAEHLAETLGPRFEPPKLLREKVSRGELGRKSGRGFFNWD